MPEPKHTILLVDDEENILEIAKTILDAEGYDTKTAMSFDEAVELLGKITPDIIISDVNMPGKSGFDFFSYVRSIHTIQNIPFIFLTGNSDIESIKKGKELGSDDYLTKPVDYYILLSTIKGKLKRKDFLKESQVFQIEQIKKQLFQLISHEMRTPLTSILGATELLSDPTENLSPQELTTFLEMLHANSKRLTSMVDDFLLATRIESGEIRNEISEASVRINPNELTRKAIHELQKKIEEQQVHVENLVEVKEITLKVNTSHLENILTRLVDNAIKFSERNSDIILSGKDDKDSFTFIVKDNGYGVPKDQQGLLFEKFRQINREKIEQQGTGLGLYIVQKLVELNKGTIWFESQEGKGSIFFVKFSKEPH